MTQTLTRTLTLPDMPAETDSVARIAALLAAYPAIAPAEVDEIVHFLRTGPHLDVGGLHRDEATRAALTRFRIDQRRRLVPGPGANLAFALAILLPIALFCWYFWNRGSG